MTFGSSNLVQLNFFEIEVYEKKAEYPKSVHYLEATLWWKLRYIKDLKETSLTNGFCL